MSNADGTVKAQTDAEGNRTEYAYDRRGWLRQIAYADGSRVIFGYDVVGHLVSMKD